MNYNDDWPDSEMENRRAMVRQTIRPVATAELQDLGERLFPLATDPWAERIKDFISRHSRDRCYLADAPGEARIVYCRDAGRGIWFIPGTGVGFIQPKGLAMLAEIVDAM